MSPPHPNSGGIYDPTPLLYTALTRLAILLDECPGEYGLPSNQILDPILPTTHGCDPTAPQVGQGTLFLRGNSTVLLERRPC